MTLVVASAPGKVLITGGYLILDKPNAGLVLSTTARFYAIIKPMYEDAHTDTREWVDLKLSSPQLSREATYKLSIEHSSLECTSSRESSNPFVEQAMQYTVAAAKAIHAKEDRKDSFVNILKQGLDITILGSNDFYSYRNQIEAQGLPLLPDTLSALPPFSDISLNTEGSEGTISGDKCKPEVAKTGLGSSAAMTTSVVAALLHYFGVVVLPLPASDISKDEILHCLDLVHIIAQSAHCIAQGKIGSGFDVCAAVYGSQRYVRFSPSVLSSAQVPGTKQLPDIISDILNERWDHERSRFSLPPLMTLLLGEPGSGGSSTPSMVGAVKKWQNANPQEAMDTRKILTEANSMLEMQLNLLGKFAKENWEAYSLLIHGCSSQKHERWLEVATDELQAAVATTLLGARNTFLQIRRQMKQMGSAAGVPIEPEPQTQLLDATMDMEGVLLCGVPGAGGFDAVFAILLGDAKNEVIKAWSSRSVLSLLVREDPRGVYLESQDPRSER